MATKTKKSAQSSKLLHFSKKEAIDFGFETAKSNLFYFVTLFVVVILIYALMTVLQGLATPKVNFLLFLLVLIIRIVVSLIVSMGLIKISIMFVDKKKPKLSDLFYTRSILNFFLVSLVRSFIVIIGFILLIIPGIILSIKLQFAEYLVVDKNKGVVDALNGSWEMTRGVKWNLFLFGILIFLINLLGLIALLVGLFITVPLTMVATAFVYRKLLLQSKSA